MRKPELILFDYGHTLVYEPNFDHLIGAEAVLRRCVHNPQGCTAARLAETYAQQFRKYYAISQAQDLDVMDMAAARMAYALCGLEFDCDLVELERIYWDAAGPGRPMPGVGELLRGLAERGVRSAVVSNMNFREENLKARIARFLPENRFEFVLCSCEYATRKPRPEYFQLALTMAGLPADRVWYCGDNPRCDVLGASRAGIFPVWYQNELDCPYRAPADLVTPDCDYLPLPHLPELLSVLDACE